MTEPDAGRVPFNTLTVIGLGLIGGSITMAARERFPDWRIRGVDPDPDVREYVLRHRVVDEAFAALPDVFEGAHLAVIATHLTQSLAVLRELAPLVAGKSVLVTDIGSCKRAIAELGETLLPTQFIAGHPMAGKEFSGIRYATPLLFAGRSYLLCPHAHTDTAQLEALKDFIRAIGGVPRLLDPEPHDRYMAYVSHLPQLYSVLLAQLLRRHDPERLSAYHGAGLDEHLRLAASPYGMWGDVLLNNADNMTAILTELQALLQEVKPLISQPGALKTWFSEANAVHGQFHTHQPVSIAGGINPGG